MHSPIIVAVTHSPDSCRRAAQRSDPAPGAGGKHARTKPPAPRRRDAGSHQRRRHHRPRAKKKAHRGEGAPPSAPGAAAGQARVPDRPLRTGLQRGVRPRPRRRPTWQRRCTGQGELLDNYYAVTGRRARQRDRADQRPGSDAADRGRTVRLYTDIAPATAGPEGQVARQRLRVPAPDAHASAISWKCGGQDVEGLCTRTSQAAAPGQPATCRHPTLGSADGDQTATPEDPYVSGAIRSSYFH